MTAVRSGEAVNARWEEIGFDAKTWTIPAERTKTAREHRVPLSEPALAILTKLNEARMSEFVFPGQVANRRLTGKALNMFLQQLGVAVTVHGFRSSFRDWAGNETSFPRELAEQALSHAIGNQAEQAYRRGDALEKRRDLMQVWARHFRAGRRADVIELRNWR